LPYYYPNRIKPLLIAPLAYQSLCFLRLLKEFFQVDLNLELLDQLFDEIAEENKAIGIYKLL
ncbi:hypothetical protein ACUOFC_63630, partial [Escherichia sp. TWPC-MK]